MKELIMFKKALLASALAGLASSAIGLTVVLNPDETTTAKPAPANTNKAGATAAVHSLEGLSGETAMSNPNVGIVLAGEYVAGDKITITYSQPFAAGETAAAGLEVIMPNNEGATMDGMTLSRDGASAVAGLSAVTYSVANVEYAAGGAEANTTVGAIVYTEKGLTHAPCAAACTLTVNASGTRDGAVIDAAQATALTTASVVKEFSLSATTSFNGVIDVGALRKAFTPAATDDAAALTLAVATTTRGVNVTTPTVATSNLDSAVTKGTRTGSTVVVTGSFGFLDCDTATAGTQLSGAPCTGTNILGGDTDWVTTAATLLAANGTWTDADASETVFSMNIDSQNTAVIPVQTMAATWTTAYTSLSSNVGSDVLTAAMGGFTMNGSATSVYAVPYGPGIQQYIWLTNEGASAGTITATAFDTSGTSYPTTGEYDLGGIAAKSHVAIASDLLAKLKADGMDDTVSQRLQVALTVTLPQANVNVYAAYRTGDARLALETSAGKDRQALLATAAALAVVDTEVGVIDGEVGTIDGLVDAEVIKTAAILVDTSTTLETDIDAILADTSTTLQAELDAIEAVTDATCGNLAAGEDGTGSGAAGDAKYATTACP
jgi:hypothetical protein